MALKPVYKVIRRAFRNAHLYGIPELNDPRLMDMHSVTKILGVINKPQLIGWAAREALDGVRRELYALLGDKTSASVILDIQHIDDIIEAAAKKPEKTKGAAADYGIRTHCAIDDFIRCKRWEDDYGDISPAINSFKKWWGAGRDLILGDTMVASKTHAFGGAFDAVEERPDGLWLLDWKSSNKIWPEMAIQVGGGYALAFEETFGQAPAGAAVVRVGKTAPSFEVKEVADMSRAKEAFLAAKTLQESLRGELFREEIECLKNL